MLLRSSRSGDLLAQPLRQNDFSCQFAIAKEHAQCRPNRLQCGGTFLLCEIFAQEVTGQLVGTCLELGILLDTMDFPCSFAKANGMFLIDLARFVRMDLASAQGPRLLMERFCRFFGFAATLANRHQAIQALDNFSDETLAMRFSQGMTSHAFLCIQRRLVQSLRHALPGKNPTRRIRGHTYLIPLSIHNLYCLEREGERWPSSREHAPFLPEESHHWQAYTQTFAHLQKRSVNRYDLSETAESSGHLQVRCKPIRRLIRPAREVSYSPHIPCLSTVKSQKRTRSRVARAHPRADKSSFTLTRVRRVLHEKQHTHSTTNQVNDFRSYCRATTTQDSLDAPSAGECVPEESLQAQCIML